MAIGCWFRKCNRTKPDYSSLPDDITEQILLKLPCIKSIVTCTSVCKSWYALIKSPRFIKVHFSSSYINRKEYFLCSYIQSQRCYSIDYYDSERLQEYYDLKFPQEGYINILGSCNGLICYAKCDHDDDNYDDDAILWNIYMWNPTIRKLRILPKPVFYTQPSTYGFWYDTDADDYKVAKVSSTKVEMYSLSTNTWDTIISTGPSDPGSPYPPIIYTNVIHVNGTLHWLLFRENGWKILSLKIKNGILKETLIWPLEKGESCPVLLSSGTHSCSLFVLRYESFTTWNCRGVMAYDESLRELYRIDLEESGRQVRLVGVRNNGNEALFQTPYNNHGGILVCNVEDLKFKGFSPSTRAIVKLHPFAETLVLLNDKDSSSTANSSMIKSMVRKARFAISGIFYTMEKAIGSWKSSHLLCSRTGSIK